MQHKEQGNVYLSKVNTVVIDEVDTMLTQGFGNDIRAILRNIMTRSESDAEEGIQTNLQLIMATATLTKAVKALLSDVKGGFNLEYSGK